ncbi:ComF family protein [Virgibacillus sp. MSJ-26]|uniref:ComF family protein n=1 Tax=Virgibacillus sp. MSJ-26 TaxID=2841522 RepID=UPI001C1118B3|nr:ComF family protein [Virgibacillus sp. MSJ-26]MBU5467801.1 ComF family protein [Virgibacillus sp. MSJ-26]
MICLWCDKEIVIETTWSNLFIPSEKHHLCADCKGELETLSGKRCVRCSRVTNEKVCADCKDWLNKSNDPLTYNYSVYAYNDRMQEMIARWKYRGDYILGKAFQQVIITSFKQQFKQMKNYAVVPIPLSEERLKERGFNQSDMLAKFITPHPKRLLTRIHGEKQSKKTRKERMTANNPFELIESLNKPVILVDDIYTTGATLRFAAAKLKQSGCPEVFGYTLIRG